MLLKYDEMKYDFVITGLLYTRWLPNIVFNHLFAPNDIQK